MVVPSRVSAFHLNGAVNSVCCREVDDCVDDAVVERLSFDGSALPEEAAVGEVLSDGSTIMATVEAKQEESAAAGGAGGGGRRRRKKKGKRKAEETLTTEPEAEAPSAGAGGGGEGVAGESGGDVPPKDSFQYQLRYCLAQLEIGLEKNNPDKDQIAESQRVMAILRSPSERLIRKRQLMKSVFGDCRAIIRRMPLPDERVMAVDLPEQLYLPEDKVAVNTKGAKLKGAKRRPRK